MTVYMRKRINTQLTFFTIFIITVVVSVISILFYDILKKQVFEDLRIIFATVKILFVPESTDGISEGQTTAADTPVDAQEFAVSGSK